MLTRHVFLCLALVVPLGHSHELRAGICERASRPAATLLFPYFEVDLANENGRSTLISIGNAEELPALAHVVLWTNWGVPTLAFDLHLEAGGVETLGLRQIFNGELPRTHPHPVGSPLFRSCSSPLDLPGLDAGELWDLRARHTGQAVGWDCASTPQEPSLSLAVGYITVDAMNDCSDTVRYPGDEGYFVDGGRGLASNRNALWGDFYLVDFAGDHAQGIEAVSIVADAGRFGAESEEPTFYLEEILSKADNRAPLSHTYGSRFVHGADFDGGTELIVWHSGFCVPIGSFACGGSPLPSGLTQELVVKFRQHDGKVMGESRLDLPLRMARLRVGGEQLPVPSPYGHLELRVDGRYEAEPGPRAPAQAWLIPIVTAQNRFSVSHNAVQLGGSCGDARSEP